MKEKNFNNIGSKKPGGAGRDLNKQQPFGQTSTQKQPTSGRTSGGTSGRR